MGRPKLPPEQKGQQINMRLPAKALDMITKEADELGIFPATHAKNIIMKALAAKHFGEWSY